MVIRVPVRLAATAPAAVTRAETPAERQVGETTGTGGSSS